MKKNRFLGPIILLLSVMMLFSSNVFASSKKVEMTNSRYYYFSSGSGISLFIKDIGLKRKSSKSYSLYYKGNKVTLGRNPYTYSEFRVRFRIENKGNKKLTFYGVKIGDSKKTVYKKIKKNAGSYYYDWLRSSNGKMIGPWYGGYVLKYKNGKLVSWTYTMTSTD